MDRGCSEESLRRGDRHREPPAQPLALPVHADPAADPNTGIWPVTYFLTESHKGYCQYFASAMGTMLRSLNIPTRLVSGYGPETVNAESGRAQRQQEVTTSDAHSWVEAYFPAYGWIAFEPTPPSTQGNYQPIPRGAEAVITPRNNAAPDLQAPPTQSSGDRPGSPNIRRRARRPFPGGGDHLARGARGDRRPGHCGDHLDAASAIARGRLESVWRRWGRSRGSTAEKPRPTGHLRPVLPGLDPRLSIALGELATVTARAEFSASGATGTRTSSGLADLASRAVPGYLVAEEISRLSRSCATSAPGRWRRSLKWLSRKRVSRILDHQARHLITP